MPSITSWLRMEPRSREDDIQTGLQAKIHDPLWMLGRQWQFNEFKGEDAGSPSVTKLEGETLQLTRYFPGVLPPTGIVAGQPFDPAVVPLETLVERERYIRAGTAGLRFSVDAGRYFLRLLESHGANSYGTAFLKQFPLPPLTPDQIRRLDLESRRFAAALSGRTIDGERLYNVMRASLRPPAGSPALPAAPPVTAADQERVIAAATNWLDWYESVVSEPVDRTADSWVNSRMEYAFAVSAAAPLGEVVLEAPDYREGNLDWFSFTVRRPASLGSTAAEARRESFVRNIIPAPVSYPGMPAERWWELEDSQIDFGAIPTLPGDLPGLVMLQFAVTYGNDWFAIPVDINVGSLLRIRAVTVTDCFGVTTTVPPFSQTAAADGWRMFTLSSNQQASASAPEAGLFFLPPVLGPSLASPALEEVLLTRDEMANMAWAIEKRVQDPTGKTVDRTYAVEEAVEVSLKGELTYRLTTNVPDNWIPLVPVKTGTNGRIRLRRGVLATGDIAADTKPLGRILASDGPLVLEDEEVPRSGARVSRNFQYARWWNGSTHLWIGRRKEPGRGEASSGLQFDDFKS